MFLSRDVQTLTRAFTVYVHPLLESSSCVWSPHFKSDRIESVQRRFTKRLRFVNNMSYRQRLISLALESLKVRRLRQDLFLTDKIVFCLINIDSSKFFTLRRDSITRFNCFLSRSRVVVKKYFLSACCREME